MRRRGAAKDTRRPADHRAMSRSVPNRAPVQLGDDPAALHREGVLRLQAGDAAGAVGALRAAPARSVDPGC